MIVSAWKSGKHNDTGVGYGVKLSIKDRDSHFEKTWDKVSVTLPNGVKLEASVAKESFWNKTCHELINKKFGEWFIEENLAPWPNRKPPKFDLVLQGENNFILNKL